MAHKLLFLIAEDDLDDQFLLQEALKAACPPELELYFVEDGLALIGCLQESACDHSGKPNLVLLDLNMPVKDGREALKEIKADPALADIPVVVLTNSINPADVQYCQQYGVVAYYRKPSSMPELQEIVGRLCQEYAI